MHFWKNGIDTQKEYETSFTRYKNMQQRLRSVLKFFYCLILMCQKASLQEQFWYYFRYYRIVFLSEEFMKAVRGKMELHV